MLILFAVLLAPAADSEVLVHPIIRWLARHQRIDGSWAAGTACCELPDGPEAKGEPARPTPEDRKHIRLLIDQLGHPDTVERDKAEDALKRIGRPAQNQLRKARASNKPEISSRTIKILRFIAVQDGPASGEVTALALLCFLGNGYSHFTKDGRDGISYGDVVRKASQWLLQEQARSGDSGAVGPEVKGGVSRLNALGAMALMNSYGTTGSKLYKDHAIKAAKFLESRQRESGAWGLGEDSVEITFWSVMALWTARICGVLETDQALAKASAWLEKKAAAEGGLAVAGAVITASCLKDSKMKARVYNDPRLLSDEPDPSKPLLCYATSLAAYRIDGPKGKRWTRWYRKLKEIWQKDGVTSACTFGSVPTPNDRAKKTSFYFLTMIIQYQRQYSTR